MNKSKSQYVHYLPLLIWAGYVLWWLAINILDLPSRDNYTDTYSLVAITGAVSAMIAAKKWGMFRSRFGSVMAYFGVGLALQFLGQLLYALSYRLGGVELAFPSIGDVPYILSNVAYIVGVIQLLRVIAYKKNVFKPWWVMLCSIATVALLGFVMYKGFLGLALQDERGAVYQLLNFLYPFIQAFYFLFGVVAIFQSKRLAGGKMLKAVLIMLSALVMQYIADYVFLYQSYHESWEAAGINDLLFVTAYGLMALSIIVINDVRSGTEKEQQNA